MTEQERVINVKLAQDVQVAIVAAERNLGRKLDREERAHVTALTQHEASMTLLERAEEHIADLKKAFDVIDTFILQGEMTSKMDPAFVRAVHAERVRLARELEAFLGTNLPKDVFSILYPEN